MLAAPPSWYRMPRWTKTSREKLSGVRYRHKSDPPGPFLDPAAAWQWLRQYYAENIGAAGLTPAERITAEPEFEAEWHDLRAGLDADAPPATLTPAQELLRAAIFLHMGSAYTMTRGPVMRALVGLWAGHDPALLFAIHREVSRYHVDGSYGGDFSFKLRLVALEPNPLGHRQQIRLDDSGVLEIHLWLAYRAWLMAASDEAFARARASASPVRDTFKNSTTRTHRRSASFLAYAFSRDPAWATEDTHELLGALDGKQRPPEGGFDLVLPGLTDPALALRLAEGWGAALGPLLGFRAFDVVESLGGDAAPVLESILLGPTLFKSDKPPIASALKLAQSAP